MKEGTVKEGLQRSKSINLKCFYIYSCILVNTKINEKKCNELNNNSQD